MHMHSLATPPDALQLSRAFYKGAPEEMAPDVMVSERKFPIRTTTHVSMPTLSLQSRTSAARLARPGRYHSQVREKWSARPRGERNVASPFGESFGVPLRRS